MSFDLNLPGLDHLLSPVPAGSTLLIEGGTEPAKSFLVQSFSRAAAQKTPVTLVTTRGEAHDATTGIKVVPGASWEDIPAATTHHLVVDSFSLLAADVSLSGITGQLRKQRAASAKAQTVQILAAEPAMLDAPRRAVLHHYADGIIQFHTREDSEGLAHFLRVPRWTGGESLTGNMYYGFDGKRLSIDTRKRVT